ncbi:GPRMGL2 (predicted) [Pycnogonum litorale]
MTQVATILFSINIVPAVFLLMFASVSTQRKNLTESNPNLLLEYIDNIPVVCNSLSHYLMAAFDFDISSFVEVKDTIDLLASIIQDQSPFGNTDFFVSSAKQVLKYFPSVNEVRIIHIEKASKQNFSVIVKKGNAGTELIKLNAPSVLDKKVPWFISDNQEDNFMSTIKSNNFEKSDVFNSFGRWTYPYYSCSERKWLISYSTIVSWNRHSNKSIQASFSADVDVSNFDINQCDDMDTYAIDKNVITAFRRTHKCHNISSKCIFVPHNGWVSGSYQCICRDGFYSNAGINVVNGTSVETAYKEKLLFKSVSFDLLYVFKRCEPGCNICVDASPCLSSYNWPFRISLLTVCIICILLTCLMMGYVYTYRKLKIIKVSSPIFLHITLIGAVIMYSEMAAIFPVLDIYSCIATKWTRHLGFCITYSALLLKTWRVSLTYRVKSAHKLKLTDKQLLQWLFPILLVMIIYLSTWTLSSPPHAVYLKDWYGLKFKQCEYGWWDHSLAIGEFLFLLWGIRVCYNVRNAESFFNEAKYISWAIYNITLVNLVMVGIHLVFLPDSTPDMKYLFGFVRTQLSTTVTIVLIFGPKFCRVMKGQGDTWDNRARARGVTASFSLNGVGLVHEDTTDLYQENEELKEEIQKLAAQMEFMKIVHMEMNNRHLKPKHGSVFSQTGVCLNQHPIIKSVYMKFDGSDSSSRISPAAEIISERV